MPHLRPFPIPAGSHGKGPRRDHRTLRLLGAAGFLALTGCVPHLGLPVPAGPVAMAQRTHFWIICALMLLVLVPIFTAIPFLLWRYRYREDKQTAPYRPDWNYSRMWEVLIWTGPVALVTVFAVLLWRQTHLLDPYRPLPGEEVQVQVVAQDWRWLFIYPEYGIATVNRLVLPAGRPAALSLTSTSVMQSFFVPALAGQIYAMAGMTTRLHLQADAPGQWTGRNAQYNGTGFERQTFTAEALPEADFDAWIQDAQSAPPPQAEVLNLRGTGDDLARALDRPADALVFGDVPATLFDDLAGGAPHHHHHGGGE
ncbi:cytochrome ubiquinol oxidase subunit II [Falsirhodobacter algicola]|uniref:cytochrome ubiquinol oxidase subunit II n=1 Tax=Falsirhodobacter algicola TaxID=2692330 RepID=UPI001BA97461|nr:cytochrome ubiquinol oxidase subunit II [Falsirhodobacter algicola]